MGLTLFGLRVRIRARIRSGLSFLYSPRISEREMTFKIIRRKTYDGLESDLNQLEEKYRPVEVQSVIETTDGWFLAVVKLGNAVLPSTFYHPIEMCVQPQKIEVKEQPDCSWITEKCGTNTPPSNPPKRPSGNIE